ncbi:MAG: hypothetical protein KDC53_00265 [Saprospiraceae bacterium]|nr:hypothetical protein [Saprospiraceae bacterium]
MNFTPKELAFIQDTDFLITKSTILQKMTEVFNNIQGGLNEVRDQMLWKDAPMTFKISRGESYRQLPYLVLDYPAFFSRNDIMCFRTMFWWGHFYSATLHLQGQFLEQFRPCIQKNLDLLENQDIYISAGQTPWEYHYEVDNYLSYDRTLLKKQLTRHFIKISQKYTLETGPTLPEKVLDFFLLIQKLITPAITC